MKSMKSPPRFPRFVGYGVAALAVLAAFGVLVLGEWRGRHGDVGATAEKPRSVAPAPVAPSTPPAVLAGGADGRLSAIERWLTAGGEGDETALGDPATYDEALVRTLTERYEALPVERRRERGALVYLLARTQPEKNALAFVRRVVREKPCLSLENCGRPPTGHDDHDPSLATTLAYPQLMALAMAESRAEKSEAPADWQALAEEAKTSDVPSVKRRAERWIAGILR